MSKRLALGLLFLLVSATVAAADFSTKDLEGHPLSLADYRGKWVVINFWATWCPYCVDEISDLSAFYRAHNAKDATVLGLSVDDADEISDAELRDFVHTNNITYPIIRATQTIVRAIGPIKGLPTTYLVDPNGKVVARQLGPMTGADLEQFIRDHASSLKTASP